MADIKVKLYDFAGKELGEEKLNADFFGVKVNPDLVQQVSVAQMANSRQVLAHTKGRAEVRGGGKKPWKQKGTGRARHGSTRSPIWIGGGITFGPTKQRNFSKQVNKKVKKAALSMVLSDKVAHDGLILVESYNLPEAKTKELSLALNKLPNKGKSTLVVTKSAEDNIVRASKNLPKVDTIQYSSLNIVDLMKHQYVLVSKELLSKVEKHYS
ncbi:50S ribosomal protein L4 [bacterium]|jgi:large subunit ribosomal protein L4|nr:50S ribosomal protein L4 [bacterium]MBT4649529.1 50S ribosomal protein L4 [bacterium]